MFLSAKMLRNPTCIRKLRFKEQRQQSQRCPDQVVHIYFTGLCQKCKCLLPNHIQITKHLFSQKDVNAKLVGGLHNSRLTVSQSDSLSGCRLSHRDQPPALTLDTDTKGAWDSKRQVSRKIRSRKQCSIIVHLHMRLTFSSTEFRLLRGASTL